MSSYEEVVEKDLELMWAIRRYCKSQRWIVDTMRHIVSKHPLRDIVLALWIAFIVAWIEIGHHHFWIAVMNVAAVMIIRRLLEAKRPVEFDPRLRPLTEVNAESYGFPSVEAHMSVVVFGDLFLHYPHFWLLVLSAALSALIGFSRVYSNSRFPHQIIGSWISGMIGLFLSWHCCAHMSFHTMRDFEHFSCMGFVGVALVAHVALACENNDSRLLHIPKREFIQVMSGILSGGDKAGDQQLASSAGDMDAGDVDDDEDGDFFDEDGAAVGGRYDTRNRGPQPRRGKEGVVLPSPRSQLTQQAQQRSQQSHSNRDSHSNGLRPRRYVKSDSLYFLQRAMEERELRQKKAQQEQSQFSNNSNINSHQNRFTVNSTLQRRPQRRYGTEDFYSSDLGDDEEDDMDMDVL